MGLTEILNLPNTSLIDLQCPFGSAVQFALTLQHVSATIHDCYRELQLFSLPSYTTTLGRFDLEYKFLGRKLKLTSTM